ncbi:MAG: hypothetical protein KC416_03070 [Myxococcales bacterium]|nr:hypothetical protein [Myxococcales bacterium]
MGGSQAASAQDVQVTGPLAGAPACRHCRIYRDGRIQLQPFAGFTLVDEYSRTMIFGLQAQYHFTDWLGLGLWGGYGGVHIDTALTDEITTGGQVTDRNSLSLPDPAAFPNQIGQIDWVGALQVTFIPLRGKLALFQELFVDSDFYFFGGIAAVGLEERADVDATTGSTCASVIGGAASDPICLQSQNERATRVAIAPTFGVGLMVYFNEFIGLSMEWRALPFSWNTSGTDEAGGPPDADFPDGVIDSDDQIFHFNHMVNIGLAFYLPASIEVTE